MSENYNSTRRISKASVENQPPFGSLQNRAKHNAKSVGWKKHSKESPIDKPFNKDAFRIINSLGDVTPKSMLVTQEIKSPISYRKISINDSKPSSNLHPGSKNIDAPFSRTVFSPNTNTMDSTFGTLDIDLEFCFGEINYDFRTFKSASDAHPNLDKVIDLELNETETIVLFATPSVCVRADSQEAEGIRLQQEQHRELEEDKMAGKFKSTSNLTQVKDSNDRLTEHSMNTFNSALKNKAAQTAKIAQKDAYCIANSWELFEYESKLTTDVDVGVVVDYDVVEMEKVETLKMLGEEENDEKLIKDHLNNITKNQNFKQMLITMERIINLNTHQEKLSIYRGLTKAVLESSLNIRPSLERLWTFKCPMTKGNAVHCMSWHPQNDDILAVGYQVGEGGLICCWSLKNLEYPEKTYKTSAPVLSLDFSRTQPNLLAAACADGTILLFNVLLDEVTPILDNFLITDKHNACVWRTNWVQRLNEASQTKDPEVLVSVSSDGRVAEWSVEKGFECHDLMKIKRVSTNAKSEVVIDEGQISRLTGGLCLDFNLEDPSLYLIGTEDGNIYKCSSTYNEQYIQSYTAHSGPVNDIAWSPHHCNIFISCSVDWSIKLWSDTKNQPLLNLHSSTKSISSLCWSPTIETVFAGVNENYLDIWDLRENTLDPILKIASHSNDARLTRVLFTKNGKGILTADTNGNIDVYLLLGITASSLDQAFDLQRIFNLD